MNSSLQTVRKRLMLSITIGNGVIQMEGKRRTPKEQLPQNNLNYVKIMLKHYRAFIMIRASN